MSAFHRLIKLWLCTQYGLYNHLQNVLTTDLLHLGWCSNFELLCIWIVSLNNKTETHSLFFWPGCIDQKWYWSNPVICVVCENWYGLFSCFAIILALEGNSPKRSLLMLTNSNWLECTLLITTALPPPHGGRTKLEIKG